MGHLFTQLSLHTKTTIFAFLSYFFPFFSARLCVMIAQQLCKNISIASLKMEEKMTFYPVPSIRFCPTRFKGYSKLIVFK